MRVPHTWFSTEFDHSRRVLRSRLRDLFASPRRWGALPLACALLVTALAGGLASCGESPASPSPAAEVLPGTSPVPEAEEAALPELDLDNLLIRYPGEEVWTDLAALIPAPAAWAEQDLGGRNEIDYLGYDTLSGDPGIQGAFVDPQNGWLTFSYSMGLGPISDTCIYRTHDGGRTWEEVGALEGTGGDTGPLWFSLNCAAFLDDHRAILCTGLFLGAPVFYTADGGATWVLAELPEVSDGWQADSVSFSGAHGLLLSRIGEPAALVSQDYGASWEVLELPRPVYDAAGFLQVESLGNWDSQSLRMLGSLLPVEDITLYGLNLGESASLRGVLLERNGHLDFFPQVLYPLGSRADDSQIALRDYDGDGVEELAVYSNLGYESDQSIYRLYLFEAENSGFSLSAVLTGEDLVTQSEALIQSSYDPTTGQCTIEMGNQTWDLRFSSDLEPSGSARTDVLTADRCVSDSLDPLEASVYFHPEGQPDHELVCLRIPIRYDETSLIPEVQGASLERLSA